MLIILRTILGAGKIISSICLAYVLILGAIKLFLRIFGVISLQTIGTAFVVIVASVVFIYLSYMVGEIYAKPPKQPIRDGMYVMHPKGRIGKVKRVDNGYIYIRFNPESDYTYCQTTYDMRGWLVLNHERFYWKPFLTKWAIAALEQ